MTIARASDGTTMTLLLSRVGRSRDLFYASIPPSTSFQPAQRRSSPFLTFLFFIRLDYAFVGARLRGGRAMDRARLDGLPLLLLALLLIHER